MCLNDAFGAEERYLLALDADFLENLDGVLAEERGAAASGPLSVLEVDSRVEARVGERSGCGMVDGLPETARVKVLVIHQVFDGVDGPAEHAEFHAGALYFLGGAL